MGVFERFLTLWVGLAIVSGVGAGLLFPGIFRMVAGLEIGHVNIVVALLICVMIYPMMIQNDFAAVRDVGMRPKGLMFTLVINWLIKPFAMAAMSWLFFEGIFAEQLTPESAQQYIARRILLRVAPCTAMVFVWS